jgi:hypothetical protein
MLGSFSKVESKVKRSTAKEHAKESLQNALIILAIAVLALFMVPSAIPAQALCTGSYLGSDAAASEDGKLALDARRTAEAGAEFTLGDKPTASASAKLKLGEKTTIEAGAKLTLGEKPTVAANAKLTLGEKKTIAADAKLTLSTRTPAALDSKGLAAATDAKGAADEKSEVQVLKIASGEDTVNLGEKAVPLGELREKPEARGKPKPGDLVDIRIERHKPRDIKLTIGDEVYGDGKDLVKFGEDIEVAEGDTISGDVVAIGGTVTVNGMVTGDCVSIGGSINIGPKGVIEGDGVSVGGCINREPGSVLEGDEVCTGGRIPTWLFRGGWPMHGLTGLKFAGLAFAVGKTLVVLFLVWLIVLISRDRVKVTSDKARSSMLASFGVGLLTIILTPIAMVLLCITLIGIPVAILLPFALIVAGLFGYTAVGLALGQRLFGGESRGQSVVTAAIVGVLLMEAIPIFGRVVGLPGGILWGLSIPIRVVGYAIVVCAFLIGLGATIMSKLGQAPRVLFPGGVVPLAPGMPPTGAATFVPPAPGMAGPGAPAPGGTPAPPAPPSGPGA